MEVGAPITRGLAGRLLAETEKPGEARLAMAAVVGVTLLGLGLRLALAWYTNQQLPDTPARLAGDEPGYDRIAWGLFTGAIFNWPGRTPVYPLLLAASYFVFGHSYAAALYVQAVVNGSSVPLTYLLARNYVSPAPSVFAATVIALDLPASKVSLLYSEALYTPLLLLVVLTLVSALKASSVRRLIPAGLLLGVANLCRPTATLFPLVVPFLLPRLWSLRLRLLGLLIYGGTMVAVILPWSVHNYVTYRAILPLDTIEGAWLWLGSPEFYHLIPEQQKVIAEQQQSPRSQNQSAQLPVYRFVSDPASIEGDQTLRTRALASIRSEPGVYAWYSAQKLVYFWLGNPAAPYDWPFDIQTARLYLPTWQIAGVIASRMVPVAALISLVVLRNQLSRFAPLLAVCGYLMAVHVVGYPEARLSEPLYPLLAVIIAGAAQHIWLKRWELLSRGGPAPA